MRFGTSLVARLARGLQIQHGTIMIHVRTVQLHHVHMQLQLSNQRRRCRLKSMELGNLPRNQTTC